MVADEPISLVSLATGLGAPVPAVRQTIERLVADYDGADGGVRRGFELREVGGGWRIYVRARARRRGARVRAHPEPDQAVAGGARDPRRDRLQAADLAAGRSRRSAPSTSTRWCARCSAAA